MSVFEKVFANKFAISTAQCSFALPPFSQKTLLEISNEFSCIYQTPTTYTLRSVQGFSFYTLFYNQGQNLLAY